MVKRGKTSPAKKDDVRVFLLLTLFRGLDWIDEGLGNILAHHGWQRVTRPQSLIMAFSDTFYVLGVLLLVAAVAVLLTRRRLPA